jgi:uncharacterized protein YjbI with pentapeptide repeats
MSTNSHTLQITLAFMLAGLLTTPLSEGATPVYVETTGSLGRGLVAMRGAECMLLLPAHVAGQAIELQVYGRSGAAGTASFVKVIGKKDDDLMLFRVESNAGAVCDDSEAAMLKAMPGPVIFIRDKTGALRTESVSIDRDSQLTLVFTFQGATPQDAQGISGSVVYIDSKPRGMVLDVGVLEDRPNIARELEYVAALEGSWLLGQAADVSNISDSLQIIETARQQRAKGDIGQIAAIEGLVRNGSALAGVDLRGVGLKNVVVNNGNLSAAQLQGANLENAQLQQANVGAARFDFANLKNVKARLANARETRFYYASADGADFSEADAAQSNWGGASARNANFRDADLSGASFFMADLTGADFSGAILDQTFFTAAILTDAKFDGAKFDRTDFTAATGDIEAFSAAQQKQMCATLVTDTVAVTLQRESPSARFSSGVDFQDLVERRLWFPASVDLLPRCATRDLVTAGYSALQDPNREYSQEETISHDFFFRYESEPYDKVGLRREFRTRTTDMIQRVQEAMEARRFLAVAHARSSDLSDALRNNLQNVGFDGQFSLNLLENLELVALKYDAEGLERNIEWKYKALYRLEVEQKPQTSLHDWLNAGYWENFFPPGVVAQELSAEHFELFRQWSVNRAGAIPSPVVLQFRLPSRASSTLHNTANRIRSQPDQTVTLLPFEVLSEKTEDRLPAELGIDANRLFVPATNSNFVTLRLNGPQESYAIQANAETLVFLRNAQNIRAEFRVLGAQVIDGQANLLNDHKIIVLVEPVRLTVFARDESSISFDF